jgi:hypothetical protein
MYFAELALMIGGSREALEVLINKFNQDDFISQTKLFRHFKLVFVSNFWIFAFCHQSYEWNAESECAWSDMYREAEVMGLMVHEQLIKTSIEWYESDDFDPCDYVDLHHYLPYEQENLLKTLQGLVTQKLVFGPELKATFEL